MSNRQWIWLIVAIAVFALAGVASVAANAWNARSVADMYDSISSVYGSFMNPEMTENLPEEPYIAKLDIKGTILSSSDSPVLTTTEFFDLDYILDYIDRLMEDENNAGILLFVDSGGGEVKASDEVYLKLMDYKRETGRPIYAYFDGLACSGAYYIAMAADNIWANRNCLCVNIGVYTQTYNLTGLFEKYGIEEVMIKSSENKGIGSVGQPWTDEQRAIYQSIIDLWYDQFVGIVAEGRGMTKEQVMALDDGREMLAPQALEAGFIDGICRYEEYEDYLLENTGLALYHETAPTGMLAFLRQFYGKLAALTPRSEAEILREMMREHEGITVMAYAG